MNEQEEKIEAYYAIAKNDSNRVTNHFPDKEYAQGWYKCMTNQNFIELNDIEIVSEGAAKKELTSDT